MNPEIAYDRFLDITGTLSQLVILSMLLERALSVIFDYHWFKLFFKENDGFKTPISLGASFGVCYKYDFDILSVLFCQQGTSCEYNIIGIILTSVIVAGGSAGAITLFQGVLNFNSESREKIIEAKQKEAEARKMKAEADLAEAEAVKKKFTA